MSDLRQPVARAMAAIGCAWRETSPGVFAASVPSSLRHHFQGQATLRVVFDPEVWQQDRRAELAAPGSGFLTGLESAIAERAGQPIRVGGVLESDGALGRTWAAQVRVTNAETDRFDHPISFEQALRFVFEVELPIQPPLTELVAVACDLEGNVLAPKELARRDPVDAYDYDEVAGAVPVHVDWPAPILEKLRVRCRAEAELRIRRTFAPELRRRTDRGAAQVEEARLAHARERADVRNAAEVDELDQEFARRRRVYEAGASGTIRVHERTVTLLVTGKDSLIARYRRRSGSVVEILPKMSLGRLRDDQCAHCQQVRTEYVVAKDAAELWCTDCGRACAAPACPGTMRRNTSTCPRCSAVRWCADHVLPCSMCGARRCPDHGGACAVCGTAGCEAHIRKHSVSEEALCSAHGVPCAIDGAILRDSELICCARSGDAVCAAHRVGVDLPPGKVIRADRLRVCAASGTRMDVDFAEVCAVDGLTYVASFLVECPITHRRLHPLNAVRVQGDDRLLHPEAIVHSTVSGMPVARDRAMPDEFREGQVLHPDEAVRCGLSNRWTAKVRTLEVSCCGRVVAQSLSANHSATGLPLCQEHAGRCSADGAVLRATELRTCSATRARLCMDHGATLDDPAGAFVRRGRVRVCAATGHRIDQDAAGTCTVDGATYKKGHLATCPLTQRSFHPRHGVRPVGDARLLHPAAVVSSYLSGQAVARDMAVRDEFAAGACLHPNEAVQCELSLRWTARVRTVEVSCCGIRVAESLAGTSAVSGRRVCDACSRTCTANHGPMLPDEVRPCALSAAQWCTAHIVRTTCGRDVGPDHAIVLDDGTWECVEHYRRCDPGGHVVAATTLVNSILTARECCPAHRARCECHRGDVGTGEYERDPYDDSAWCPDQMVRCVRCGERAPRAVPGAPLCRWCAAPAPLDKVEPSFTATYRGRIVANLPWYTVRLSVRVTGTPALAWFWIGTITGSQLAFRVTADAVDARTPGATGDR